MRALTSRDRHRDTRIASAHSGMRKSIQQSVARCSKLGLQIDSESSSVKLLSQDAPELTAHIYGKCFAANSSLVASRSPASPPLRPRRAIFGGCFPRQLFDNPVELAYQ